MKVHVLEERIKSGSLTFPVYVGFLRAEDLLKVAEVPNFKDTTSNHEIATNVLTPPVKQWQRPLLTEKRNKIISTFNGSGEFMPNPVLVAERCVGPKPEISIEPLMADGGIPTEVKVVTISNGESGDPALWIIDGQHRITGLGDPHCNQRDNPIPVVFLLNSGGASYNGRNLAKIFAQVTTEATPLAPLHKEWLTFAFNLDSYNKGSARHKAMDCIAKLCNMPDNQLNSKPNRFHDDIKFNDMLASPPKFLGHQYDCKDLSGLVCKYYYDASSKFPHIEPIRLAQQISMAFDVLKHNVVAPQDKSVFFGSGRFGHKIMCDAYLVGVLSYLRQQKQMPTEADWNDLLTTLNFRQTDWNFQQHIISTTRWVEKSRSLAFDVFDYVFGSSSLPASVNNLWDYLSGDQLFIELEFKHVNSKGNAVKKNSQKSRFDRGCKKTESMSGRKYFRVASRSKNAKHIEIVDEKSSPSDPITFKTSGEYLRAPKVDGSKTSQNPLTLTVKCILYGGNEERLTISLAGWK